MKFRLVSLDCEEKTKRPLMLCDTRGQKLEFLVVYYAASWSAFSVTSLISAGVNGFAK